MPTDELTPPVSDWKDHAHHGLTTLTSAVPALGGPITELVNWVVQPSLERRLHDWRLRIGEELRKRELTGQFDLEGLQENEQFIDVVVQASRIAMTTSSKDKREALRNAVLNAALPSAPDESRQMMFLSMVERFTPMHLRLLSFVAKPKHWYEACGVPWNDTEWGTPVAPALSRVAPDMLKDRNFCDKLAADLHSEKLVAAELLSIRLIDAKLKALGEQFFKFISEPPAE